MLIRTGVMSEESAAELVPGDLVYVRAGDKIPADMRVVFCREMKVGCCMIGLLCV